MTRIVTKRRIMKWRMMTRSADSESDNGQNDNSKKGE